MSLKMKVTSTIFYFLQTYISSISYSIVKINDRLIVKTGIKQHVCAIMNTMICLSLIVYCFSNYTELISVYKFKKTVVIRTVALLLSLHPFIILIINFVAFFVQKNTLLCNLVKLSIIKQKLLTTIIKNTIVNI